jgi:2-polyprenyl-6-methoxyphenol hydroxylase-like FAD-dependent oxidoreductase
MTPFRGIGANTALRDAELLCRYLVAAAGGEKPLLEAIHAYEVEMVRYGFAAVRSSQRACEQAVANGATSLTLRNTVLKILNVLPIVKRHMFSA